MSRLGRYVKASTANPTGWRPWNSRLSFYIPNSFPLPTTGRGRFLLQPGVCGCTKPTVNGGMSGLGITFPNYPGIAARGNWITHGGYPAPVYRPPKPVGLSGLGAARTAPHQVRRAPIVVSPSTPSGTAVARSNGSTSNATGTRQRSTNWMAETGWGSQGSSSGSGQGWRGRSSNPTQQPGYVVGSDASGNPIYAQPPLGQVVTGYDAQGNPIYGPATSTVGTGGVVNAGAAGAITGYDASGNPIYSSAPAGATITGYDANGNPIYSTGAASTSASATGTSWFSEDSLGLGLNNGIYTIGAIAIVFLLKKR